MKQISTTVGRVPLKLCLVLSLTVVAAMFSVTTSAHNVRYYNPPCFTQGTTVTVPVWIANAGAGSYYHWQYRIPGGSWTYLSNGNNTINGFIFTVANASFNNSTSNNSTTTGALLTPQLTISGAGYTTQLDNVELRILMTDGLDPQTNAVNTWGGEEFLNPFEAKYIRLISKPNTEQCYSNCTGNVLVVNPVAVPYPPIEEYWGGFEMGTGVGTENFTTVGVNGATAKAATDLTQWTTGTFNTNAYRVINNPDSVSSTFNAIAPHTGRQLMIARVASSATRIWQRTIVVSNASNFYNGQVTFKAWFSKIDAGTNPCMTMEIKGATTQAGTVASFSGGSATTTVTATSGNWVQISVTVLLPVSQYKKLEFSIHTCNASNVNVAVDDICLLEPAAGPLPVKLTPLKGAYSSGVAHLTWGTEQELNSSHFEIEHSTNGVNFSYIGRVNAAGNSSSKVDYKFDDVKANAGMNYYRLRMVDKDGRFEYSNIVNLNVTIKGFFVTGIYPSPFTDKVNVSISSENAAIGNIRLVDNAGKVLAKQTAQIHKGITTITFDNLGNLAKGFYIIEVQSGETVVTQKLMK